jgi:hypothetical protein
VRIAARTFARLGAAVAGGALLLAGVVAAPAQAVTAPPAPTLVKASPGAERVLVSWKSGGGSTVGFNVYRSTTATVALTAPRNGASLLTGTSFLDRSITDGRTYWFVVQSVDGAGHKRQSAAVKVVVPLRAPGVPLVTATPGNARATLNFAPGVGGPVTGWLVYRSTTATGIVAASHLLTKTALAGSARSYVSTGLKNGTTYYFVVRAVNKLKTVSSRTVGAKPVAAPVAAVLGGTVTDLVHLTWTASVLGGPVASWQVYRSTSSSGIVAPANLITPVALGAAARSYDDSGRTAGTTYYYVVVGRNATGTAASNTKSAVPTAVAPNITNPDLLPSNSRFVMSRMGSTLSDPATPSLIQLETPKQDVHVLNWYRSHDVATVRINNPGSSVVTVTGLDIANDDALLYTEFTTSTTVPFTIPAGGHVDVPVTFVYTNQDGQLFKSALVKTGTLTVHTTGVADKTVALAGVWQQGPNRSLDFSLNAIDGNYEAYVSQVVNDAFGWTTDFATNGYVNSPIDSNDPTFKTSPDEVLSKFWKAADSTKPVTVTRLAAETGVKYLAKFNWYAKSDANGCDPADAMAPCNLVFDADAATGTQSDPFNGQGVLPAPNPGSSSAASGSFSPNATVFGLQIISELSDWTRNNPTNDITLHACDSSNPGDPATQLAHCGQHMRFFQVKTADGVVPNTYMVTMDIAGQNNDFNDHMFIVTNLAPSA